MRWARPPVCRSRISMRISGSRAGSRRRRTSGGPAGRDGGRAGVDPRRQLQRHDRCAIPACRHRDPASTLHRMRCLWRVTEANAALARQGTHRGRVPGSLRCRLPAVRSGPTATRSRPKILAAAAEHGDHVNFVRLRTPAAGSSAYLRELGQHRPRRSATGRVVEWRSGRSAASRRSSASCSAARVSPTRSRRRRCSSTPT